MADKVIGNVYPGFHKQFRLDRFGEDEQKILKKLSNEWYLTNSGKELHITGASYNYFLMKPTVLFSEMFNIDREIICTFSNYPCFEPRAFDAFDVAQNEVFNLRTETVCRVLISDDDDTENKIESILKTDPEQPIVIPFTYRELLSMYDDFFIRNRFRKHFYTRDLFDFRSPLRKDLYFFGRSSLIQDIINRHHSHEHTGVFGLRKSGKTSIIYAVERSLEAKECQCISIDCESPSVHKLRWNEFLFKLASEYVKINSPKNKMPGLAEYTEKTAADLFTDNVLAAYNKKHKQTLFIFDEIERISPKTAASEHWRDGDDFVYLWQTLRGFYQRYPDIFTYMVVGTNPSCIEVPVICKQENPLFSSISYQFVPSFDVTQVRQMVRKLSRYMGLRFDEIIYAKLTDDFGGHPFLIRQMCSHISKISKGDRPVAVDKALYDKAKTHFEEWSVDYLDMIVQVLRDWYPDEYDMLNFLAQGDLDTFHQFAVDHSGYTKHLIGYGLLQKSVNGYAFNIESVRQFLVAKHKYSRMNLSQEEMLSEVSSRRNRVERSLRKLINNSLKLKFGKKGALEKVLAAIPEPRRMSAENNLSLLLSLDSSPLYFLDLVNIVRREWEAFANVFAGENKNKIVIILEEINSIGRPDAHSKLLNKDEFTQLRLHFQKIELILAEWV